MIHRNRRISALIAGILFISFAPLFSQEPSPLETELERDWLVVILPFSADDNEVLRSSPLTKTLPNVIRESLKFLRQRWLQSGERDGYIKSLEKRFPDEELSPELVPEDRVISFMVSDISSNLRKQLYFSSLRENLSNETPFPVNLITRLKEETQADLFIAGNIRIQAQYAFIDLRLISPYLNIDDGVPALTQDIFSLRSIEAQTEVRQYIARDFGRSIYNAPAGSLEVGRPPTDDLAIRVYIDDEYRGTAPLFAAPLSAGTHTFELYAGKELLLSSDLEISENETTEREVPPLRAMGPPVCPEHRTSGLAGL